MNRETGSVLIGGLVVLVAAAAIFLGLAGGQTTTTILDEVAFESIPTDGSAIVVSKMQNGGVKLVGVRLQQPDYDLDVSFAVPEACLTTDGSGNERLRSDGECSDLPARGSPAGGGVTAGGDHIVRVRIRVSRDCYEAVPLGLEWPTALEACAVE